MKAIIQLAVSLTLMYSCSCTKKTDKLQPVSVSETKALRYLALGDSYTIGESVSETQRFPAQLAEKLAESGKQFKVRIIAKTGWTTDELAAGIAKEEIEGQKFDFVTLLIGVNNEFRNRPVSTYIPEFESLLNKAVVFADGKKERVFVLSIPDYSFTPTGVAAHGNRSERINAYNTAAKNVCEALGVQFVDITPISRSLALNESLVADDGLHPSGYQYKLWVEKLFPLVWTQVGN